MEGYAEFYSAELSEKVLRGLTENALKCKVNGGSIPFGYKINAEQKLEPDPAAAPIVGEIFRLYADGKTIKQIVDYLNERHILTRKGNPMTINRVTYMLKNRKYIGEFRYMEVVIPNGVEPLVSTELFDKVQTMLEKNKKAPAMHKAEDDYLLTTKLFCGKCEAMMVGESGTSMTGVVHHYYKCAKAKKHNCDKKAVRKDLIEDAVVAQTVELLNNDELIEFLVDELFKLQDEENPRLPMLKEQLADINKKIENMLNAIEQGIILPSTKERLTELEQKRGDTEVAILQEQIKRPTLTKDQIYFLFDEYRRRDYTTKENRQRLIDTFINAIYLYDDGTVKIAFNGRKDMSQISLSDFDKNKNSSDIKGFGAPKKGRMSVLFLIVIR